jgi:hypothetical protein
MRKDGLLRRLSVFEIYLEAFKITGTSDLPQWLSEGKIAFAHHGGSTVPASARIM